MSDLSRPLSDKIALVTGASRGIGKAITRALADAGAHVIAVVRSVSALKRTEATAGGGSVTFVEMDLRDHEAIDRLGATLFERHRRLDVLVGNAGQLGAYRPLEQVDPRVWDEVMSVNVTANWRLIRAFDPLLRMADAARVVFVTSGAGQLAAGAYWGPYSVSKAALDSLARIYAAETTNTCIKVNLFAPGPIRTQMRAAAAPSEDPMTLDTPEQAAEHILRMCLPDWQESGRYYSYPAKALLDFQPAKPIA